MYQNPFDSFDESPEGQPFQQQFFPPQFGGNPQMPMIPGPWPGQRPGQGPGQGPWPGQGPGQGQGGNTPMPMGPPPSFSPQMDLSRSQSQQGSSGIRRCIYRNTFIWQRSGNTFWFFPTFVSSNVIFGFRWGRFGWVYSTVNRNTILTFQCF